MKFYKLDLHRNRHVDVERKVTNFIEAHWSEKAELEIITGNSSNMKNLVIEILEEYTLEYSIGRKFDVNNKGYIVTWTGV